MKLVLDTNAYCDYAEGRFETVNIMATHGESIFIPAVVLGELSYGFRKGRQRAFNEEKLQEVISLLQIEILNITAEVASKYGKIYLSLVKKGRLIPINDVWIAASCMDIGGTLLTRDRHFQFVDEIDSIIL